MELKTYQQKVLDDLAGFLALLNETRNISEAFRLFWTRRGVKVGAHGVQTYQNQLPGVPNVCLKVPTGGGKTFIAASAIKTIFDALPHAKTQAVVWLVPSDSILEQTIRNLSDVHHPYRQRINTDFSHRVEVYTKDQLLGGQNFCPAAVQQQLSIFVLSYDSFRTSKKEGRKAYQENGNLVAFAQFTGNPDILLADTDETALIQVIRALNPAVIVDESHHAASSLSKEMLQNFNPGFVLDLTATPKKESNIITYVDALQLKAANMVKLPVIVYNRHTQTDVLSDAINIRNKLEAAAKRERRATGRYIRPIALLQAEPRTKDDSTTFQKIKQSLVDSGIPKAHVAIKTADINELRGVDLLSEDCPIRYIITVNALKEGWDCPFAYVLATIANRSSQVDVEQILGRVLRLPYTEKNTDNLLNLSYVITSSADFHVTLDRVVAALNRTGFSERDYRIGGEEPGLPIQPAPKPEQLTIEENSGDDIQIDTATVLQNTSIVNPEEASISENDPLFAGALAQAQQYEAQTQNGNSDLDAAPLELRDKMNVFRMQPKFAMQAAALCLPQFVRTIKLPLFGEENPLLSRDNLLAGFTLRDKDTMIDFSTIDAEIAQVDIAESEETPKALKLSGFENQYMREWFGSASPKERIARSRIIIKDRLSRIDTLDDGEINDYIGRIVAGLTPEQLEDLQQSPHIYLAKIKKKIDALMDAHREKTFILWIEQGKVSCKPTYMLPESISLVQYTKSMTRMLYAAEEEMNGLERDVAWELANMPNILWWHRNMARRGFVINGYVNAYPDIIAMTTGGMVLMVEPKGDHLENTESRQKVEIGRRWQHLAGDNYRYYMVFCDKDLRVEGAVHFDRFLEIVRGL